jgi:hypothetical protein
VVNESLRGLTVVCLTNQDAANGCDNQFRSTHCAKTGVPPSVGRPMMRAGRSPWPSSPGEVVRFN